MANIRGKGKPLTLSQLADHYSQRELSPSCRWKTHSTKLGYRGYLRKWIIPRWGGHTLVHIRAGEIELWLRSLPLARSICSKIRNVMSVLFNHGLRHELLDRNPVQWVRQSAKRKQISAVFEIAEVRSLLDALDLRERTMVLLDVVTGLRASELFGLKWTDIDFAKNEIRVMRSIVLQVVGPRKTEASQKPVPLDPFLARTLRTWRARTKYKSAGDQVFASPCNWSPIGTRSARFRSYWSPLSLLCRNQSPHFRPTVGCGPDQHRRSKVFPVNSFRTC